MSRLTEDAGTLRRNVLESALRGLKAWYALGDADAARLLNGRHPLHWAPAGGGVAWEDGYPGPKLIVRGWACEARSLPDARRQIYSFLLPGDICFPTPPGPSSRFTVLALTPTRLLSFGPALADRQAGGLRRLIEMAQVVNTERRYDAALRLGQLTSEERILDLLWELCDRLAVLGLVRDGRFRLPLTQRHLADSLGMSEVHLGRTLIALRRRRKLEIRAGEVRLMTRTDPDGLGRQAEPDQRGRRPKRPR